MTIDTPVNLREVGRLRVLEALHAAGRSSRPELVRVTGLSRATVSALIADLIAVGLVTEDESQEEPEPRRTGRPAQSLSLVATAGFAIGAHLGHQHVRVILCDLLGTALWEHWAAKEVDPAPKEALDLVGALIARALQETGVARHRVLGVGVGIASPVDKATGTIGAEGIMPGWLGVRISEELGRRTALPVRVTNDANAGALAERMYGAGRRAGDMIYLRLSAGIGAGIVSDGRLLTGTRGLAGEIGHLPLTPDGLICRCGNRGCLETVASPVAIARLLADSWRKSVTPHDLPGLIAQRNIGALRAVRDAGDAVGRALSTLVTLLNPRLVVVGGDLAGAGEDILEPIRAGIRRHTLPSAAESVEVVGCGLGDSTEVRGAAGMVLLDAPQLLAAASTDLPAPARPGPADLGAVVLAGPSPSQGRITAHNGGMQTDTPLISAAELASAAATTVILDVRYRMGGPPGHGEYAKGHIARARYVDLDTALAGPPGAAGRHPLPDVGVFGTAMRAAGVDQDADVVVYDDWNGWGAARAWWLLRWAGHRRVRVLDGGLGAWKAAGLPLSTDEPAPGNGDFGPRPDAVPVLDAEGAAELARRGVLLDARAGERYRGETEPIDPVAGHIPGALNAPTTDNVGPDGLFHPAAVLAQRFAALGAVPGAEVGVYCGSGVSAAHEILALAVAGVPAALYVGSWSEWTADPARPVATGPEPS